jgi:16S rRNA (guanine1207-N2)-methyltransferase
MSEGHYFDADPAVASRPGQVQLVLPDFQARLRSDRGVFSAGAVDPGTLHLLKSIPTAALTGNLLDLGCGYGPIACTLAHRSPLATVWAIDVNERALALTAANAEALGQSNVRVIRPEDAPSDLTFAGIWSNPPIRIGKAALHDLLLSWLPRLEPSGSAWLVVQRHLGADSLASWLGQSGWAVARVGSKRGYRILKVEQQ